MWIGVMRVSFMGAYKPAFYFFRHPRACPEDPRFSFKLERKNTWMPACAGMTTKEEGTQ
jgi:hypothetical protein